MSNNYAGIDYSGLGSTVNRDVATGIRYGVISQNSIQPDVMSDIWGESEDLSYKAAKDDILDRILASCASGTQEERIENIVSDIEDFYRTYTTEDLDKLRFTAVEIEGLGGDSAPSRDDVWSVIEDQFNDRYEDNGDRSWLWKKDGYTLSNCLQSDVFVSKSPYFTYAQFCSPCVPGAVNLDSHMEKMKCPHCGKQEYGYIYGKSGIEESGWGVLLSCDACGSFATPDWNEPLPARGFCLGHDFFENEEAPYPVFSVATGKRVVMVEKKEECPNCKGGGSITYNPNLNPSAFPAATTAKCGRCGGLGYEVKKVEVEQ